MRSNNAPALPASRQQLTRGIILAVGHVDDDHQPARNLALRPERLARPASFGCPWAKPPCGEFFERRRQGRRCDGGFRRLVGQPFGDGRSAGARKPVARRIVDLAIDSRIAPPFERTGDTCPPIVILVSPHSSVT